LLASQSPPLQLLLAVLFNLLILQLLKLAFQPPLLSLPLARLPLTSQSATTPPKVKSRLQLVQALFLSSLLVPTVAF
jgi:hypothetical protein